MGARRLETLKRRAEFLRLRGGARWACRAFVIEAKPRIDRGGGDRFGFTVTKALGSAVVRNRIRRRLRDAVEAAIRASGSHFARDHVIVARAEALTMQFGELVQAVVTGLARVRTSRPAGQRPRT